jgi:hypothetical protein
MSDWFVLRYPARFTLAVWASTVLLIASIVAAAAIAEAGNRPHILACLLLTPATAWLVLDGHRVRHIVGPPGLRYRGLFSYYPHVQWSDLTRAQWSESTKRLTLYTSDGKTLRFSGLLDGIERLFQCLTDHAPHVQVDETTATKLNRAHAR